MLKADNKKTELHLLILFIGLVVPLILYINRHIDDNRLVSWQWVMGTVPMPNFFIIILSALLLAWGISFISFKNYRPPFLFVISFVAASLFWSEPEVIVDASRYFTQAKQLDVNGLGYFFREWGKDIFAWTDMPVVPFFYGLTFKVFGEQRIFVQLATTFSFSCTVVLTYQLGKTLWNEDIGFYGGLLLLGIPYLYTQIPLMLVDVATMFFLVLSMVAVTLALKKGGFWRVLGAALSVFFVLGAKYSTWLLLSVMPVIFAWFFFKDPLRTTRKGAAIVLFVVVFSGALFFYYQEVMVEQIQFLITYQKPGLKRWEESYVSTFLFQVHPFITAGAFFSIIVAVAKKDWKYIIISYLVLLLIFMQVKRIRYTLPVFPMVALMAAYGLQEIKNRKVMQHLVFSVVGTSLAVAMFFYLPFMQTMGAQNLQAAGKYLDGLQAATAEVITFAGEKPVLNPAISVPLLDIYTQKGLYYIGRVPSHKELEKAKTSPLRFTWEYPIPEYYRLDGNPTKQPGAIVIVADDSTSALTPDQQEKIAGLNQSKTFQKTSGVFQHQTFVTVYHK